MNEATRVPPLPHQEERLPEDKRKLLPLNIFSALPSEQQMRAFAPASNGFHKGKTVAFYTRILALFDLL